MNRIDSKFAELKTKNEKALIAFITAGDPNLEDTESFFHSLEETGADLIELGIPFSDPSADGPVIQRSSERALRAETNLESVLELVEKIRIRSQTPIILMGYYNPVLQFGVEKFCIRAAQAGVDGLIVVDLPPEESDELALPAAKQGLHFIYLLTPTADDSRIQKVKSKASGFIYFVSVTGITGSKLPDEKNIKNQILKIKKNIPLPLCVGFGIQSAEQAKLFSSFSDGVVVGSALVSIIEENNSVLACQKLRGKIREIKSSLSLLLRQEA
ncbi:MAG: tryptophan synthase subunit alpha [Deltaproteobacteria bacterium]|nr:tryptophan synthase subunit alpha [Deltaproteobacteria bacterium]